MDWKKLMKLAIIEAPFNCPEMDEKKYKWYMSLCIKDCFDRGESPFSADSFYHQFLDAKVLTQRTKAISAGLEWARYADVVAFYIDFGISEAMKDRMKIYKAQHKKIECRTLFPA